MQKRKVSLFVIMVFILVMAIAFPVNADGKGENGKEPVGVRVSLWDGDQTVSGSFHVEHGHVNDPQGGAFGKARFVLEINGVEQDGSFLSYKVDGVLNHTTLYNFPEGLPPGDYTFTGTWYDPCFWFSDTCDKDTALADPPYVVEIAVTVLP